MPTDASPPHANRCHVVSSRLVVETKETEVSGLLAAAGALLVLLAAGLSVWWFGRVM